MAADVLSTNHQILQAIMEGGLQVHEEEKEKESDEELDVEKAENKMVQSILSKDSVSLPILLSVQAKQASEKKEQLVEELD